MIKSKKLLLGSLATVAMVATPIAAVVSCGTKKPTSSLSMLKLIKMDEAAKKTMATTLKGTPNTESDDDAKARIIKGLETHPPFVKSDLKALTESDKKPIKDAQNADEAYKAFQALISKGLFIYMPAAKAVVTFNNGKEVKFDKMVTQAEYDKWAAKPEVAEAGSAATTGTTTYADSTNPPQGTGTQKPANTNGGTTTTTTTGKAAVNTVLIFKGQKIDLGKFVSEKELADEVKKQVSFHEATKEIKIKVTSEVVYAQIKDFPTRAAAIISQIKRQFRSDAKGTQFTDADFKAIKAGTDKAAQDKAIDAFMKKDIFTSNM